MVETVARGIRINRDVIPVIEQRAKRRKLSFNAWVKWAIEQGLRPHVRKEKDDLNR